MGTLFIILSVIAFLVWAGRAMREREKRKFRDVDAKMLTELQQQHPGQSATEPVTRGLDPQRLPVERQQHKAGPSELLSVLTKTATIKKQVLDERTRNQLLQLESVVANSYRVLVKVALEDLVTASTTGSVSFAICHKQDFNFEIAVEFDDQVSQTLVQLLSDVGKPLIQISDKTQPAELSRKLEAVHPSITRSTADSDTRLKCPKCYGKMKLRAPSSGKNAGKKYWLCNTYPRCRGVIPV